MLAAVLSCWALLLGLGLLMLGNGLQGSLLGLRASLEGFPTTTTGLDIQGVILDHRRAYGDGRVHVPLPGDVAHRAAVNAALDRFQFIDDLHRPNLRRATQGARR